MASLSRRLNLGVAIGRRDLRTFCNTPLSHVSSEKKETTPPPPPVNNIFGCLRRYIQSKRDDVLNELQKREDKLNFLIVEDRRLVEESCQLANDLNAFLVESFHKLEELDKELQLVIEEKKKEMDKEKKKFEEMVEEKLKQIEKVSEKVEAD